MGWAEIDNGTLIRAAQEAGFAIMVTCDRKIRYQQNLAGRRIALIEPTTGAWPVLRNHLGLVVEAIAAAGPESYRIVTIPRPPLRRRPFSGEPRQCGTAARGPTKP